MTTISTTRHASVCWTERTRLRDPKSPRKIQNLLPPNKFWKTEQMITGSEEANVTVISHYIQNSAFLGVLGDINKRGRSD